MTFVCLNLRLRFKVSKTGTTISENDDLPKQAETLNGFLGVDPIIP